MLGSIKRSLKSRQIGVVHTYHLISGTASTPVDSGLDQYFTASVQDLGAGNYKINFKEAARISLAVIGVAMVTADKTLAITAIDASSVTVQCKSVGTTPAAADADFYITLAHMTLVSDLF